MLYWCWIYYNEDEVKKEFIKCKAAVESRLGMEIKSLRTDDGLECCGDELDKYIKEWGVKREFYSALNPKQNAPPPNTVNETYIGKVFITV